MDVGERYVLGRLIGQGATAHVYQAVDTLLRREVAVKVFRDTDTGDSRSERIDEEARILASLAHPHLLPVYDFDRGPDGHRFIVMPLVRGTTLARVMERGPVGPREVKRIGRALADALSHIHARGIVHRDVKPGNVLIAADGTPYLADFGYAHAAGGPALTATDCVVGTAGYLAPEQARGLGVTPAADVYALGLVLLEALTGKRAYTGTPRERAAANALRPPVVPARLGPGWLKILRTLTAMNPSARVSAAEAGALLESGEDELPEITASDATMELPTAASWTRSPANAAKPVPSAASSPAHIPSAATTRVNHGRRLAAFGVAGFVAAFAVVGLGADFSTPGAAADTHAPGQSTPGAGAPGPRRAVGTSRTAVAVQAGSAAAASVSASASASAGKGSVARKAGAGAGAKAEAGGGRAGDGNGKHKKCQGGGQGGGR